MHDESITFSTVLDNTRLEKDLASLSKKIEKKERDVADFSAKMAAAKEKGLLGAAELDAEGAKLEEIKKHLREIRAMSGDKSLSLGERESAKAMIPSIQAELSDQQTRVRALRTEYNKTENAAERYAAQLAEAEATLERQKAEAGELVQQIEAANGVNEQAGAKMESAAERVRSILLEGANGLKLGFIGIAEDLKDLVGRVAASAASLAKGTLQRLTLLAGKASKSFLSLFKSSSKVNSSFMSGAKKLLLYSVGIRSLYTLAGKLRTVLADGLKDLAKYSGEVNGSMSTLKSALTQLKNSLTTAFAPILTTVTPAVSRLINMCSAAADAVARLMAMLSGKSTYVRAIATQEDYAESLKETGGAADEAAKSMAGFDEINQLTSQNAGGGAGGAGGAGAGDMFETVDIEPLDFSSWGEAFSAMLDGILNDGIPKLKEGLSALAGWINAFSGNLYEMFTFPGVYDKVVAIGAELANALNGLVGSIDWYQLGQALGTGLNLALALLVSFIYTFDWISLGMKLAEFINGLVSEIDWRAFGQLLWAKFKLALETLAGFLLGLNMEEMAQAASNIAMGFFDSMSQTIQGIDWQQIGQQVAAFLAGIDWAGVAESCFTAIGSAFGAATAFLWGLIKDAWSEVVNWWRDAAYEDGQFTVEGLLQGIKDVLASIGSWIKTHIFDPFINGFKAAFGIASPSTVMAEMGGYMIDGLFEGLSGLWEKVKGLFTDSIDNIKEVFSLEKLKEIGTNMLDGLFKGLADIGQRVANWGSDFVNKVKNAFDIHSPSGKFEDIAFYMMAGLENGVSENTDPVVAAFTALFAAVTALCTENTELMQLSIAALLTYFTTQFAVEWEKGWYSCYKNANSNINLIISDIDRLNAKLASIPRVINIKINIQGAGALGGLSGLSGGGSASGFSARMASMPALSMANVPALARGAVIPPNREFLAVLGDQRRGNNLELPESLLRQVVREEMGGSGQTVVLLQAILSAIKAGQTIEVNHRQFGQIVRDAYNAESSRVGVSFAEVSRA